MPDFQLVAHPVFSPTSCVTCATTSDPRGFVDLLVDINLPISTRQQHGRLYMCATCVDQAARRTGNLNQVEADDLMLRLGEALEEISRLRAELEVERSDESKILTLADARRLLTTSDLTVRRGPGRPRKEPPLPVRT